MVSRKTSLPILFALPFLFFALRSLAQDLGNGFTCQDLIDSAAGKASRSTDGGKTYVPVRKPQPRDRYGAELLAHDTYNCQRLQRGEISFGQFTAERAERANRLQDERQREALNRANFEA